MATGQSYFRDLIFFEESSYGTMGTTGYELRVNELTPRSEQGVITNQVYTGNRLPAPPFRDLNSVGISFTCPVYMDEIGWILKHGVGEGVDAGAGPYTHTGKVGYTDGSVGDLPTGCSFEIGYTDLATPLYHQFSGGRINELVIPFGAGGPAQIQVTAVCQDDDPDVTSGAVGNKVSHAHGKGIIELGQGDGARRAVAVVEARDDAEPAIRPTAIVGAVVVVGIVAQVGKEEDPPALSCFFHQPLAAGLVKAKDVLGETHLVCHWVHLGSGIGT